MSVNKCSCNGCALDVWKEYDKCVLHCPKGTYSEGFNDGTLSKFYDEFKKYIIDTMKLDNSCDNEELDSKIITGEITVFNLETTDLKDCFISPTLILFPERDARDIFDYVKILNKFGKIHFDYCEFYTTDLKLMYTEVFFQDCTFYNSWNLYDYIVLENIDDIVYQTCHFKNSVTMYNSQENDKEVKLSCSQFDYTCRFSRKLELTGIVCEEPLFKTNQTTNYLDDNKINTIQFINCIFKQKFILNNYAIDNFKIEKCLLENKFEFEKNKIKEFTIDDSNFKNLVDFYKTEFIEFKIYKSIFEDFVGFEECKFGKSNVNKKDVALFEYATFLDFTNFRNTKFLSGLNMEKINLKEYPNFLGSFVEFQNTNRETFRILKYSYDKIGNHIEANKYFSLEMKKHKVELINKPLKGHLQEKFIFWVNDKMSNFGQSFLKPIGLIILFTIIYGVIVYGNEQHWLMSIYPKGSEYLNSIVHWLNYPLKEFRPLEKILKKDYEFVSLIFNVIFSVLIWQTIVAVKRYTKR